MFRDTPLFRLYKGTIPTPGEIEAEAGTPQNFRTADILATLVGFNDTSGVTRSDNQLILSPAFGEAYVAASATGTAAWFGFYGETVASNVNVSACVIGTVTVTSGGGDVEMSNISIVSGQTYKIGPVYFEIPYEYTY